MDGEQQLVGGRMGGAMLVEGSVRRPVRPWSTGVRAVLTRLEEVGFEAAPRYLGVDDKGREMLEYLPGRTLGEPGGSVPEWVWSETLLGDVASWLRQLHDATDGWQPPTDAQWFGGRTWTQGQVVGHQDAAPWNVVVREGRLVGFVDWDLAAPSSRAMDLAWTALTWVPLLNDVVLPRPPDLDRSWRLGLLLDGYGYDQDRQEFGVTVARRARTNADAIHRMVDAGDPIGESLLPWARGLEASAREVERLPSSFWAPS